MLIVNKNSIKLWSVAILTILLVASYGAQSVLAGHQNDDGGYDYATTLSGDNEVPAVETDTTGTFQLTINEEETAAMFNLEVQDGMAITAAHLHCGDVGENGPVFTWLFGNIPGGFNVDGTLAAFTLTDANILEKGIDCATPITNIPTLMSAIDAGEVYVNVHNVENPGGVVRGQIKPDVPNMDDDPNEESADKDNDGFISVAEGVPFYGAIVDSLTTSGDTSPASALALERFPVANNAGSYTYERTFMLSDDTDLDEAHVIIHGADIDQNGAYDGEKQSSIAEGVPFEATVPVACGVLYEDSNGVYRTSLTELNSTGVTGDVEVEMINGEAKVYLTVEDASPNLAHAQHIHQGGSNICPPNTVGIEQFEEDDDENGDDDVDYPVADPNPQTIQQRIDTIRMDLLERLNSIFDRISAQQFSSRTK